VLVGSAAERPGLRIGGPDRRRRLVDEFDEQAGPTGARGIGELGGTGVAAAIANAVYDAIGVRVRAVPILPKHILEALG
jgi:xanthine dehydrogenase YagR molybdenum-binding subunit